jgi:hypothetical protein
MGRASSVKPASTALARSAQVGDSVIVPTAGSLDDIVEADPMAEPSDDGIEWDDNSDNESNGDEAAKILKDASRHNKRNQPPPPPKVSAKKKAIVFDQEDLLLCISRCQNDLLMGQTRGRYISLQCDDPALQQSVESLVPKRLISNPRLVVLVV